MSVEGEFDIGRLLWYPMLVGLSKLKLGFNMRYNILEQASRHFKAGAKQ